MSKASRQTISLLAIISGVFKTMGYYELSDECAPTISYGIEVSDKCIYEFPETGDSERNIEWSIDKIHEIEKLLNGKEKDIYNLIILSSIAHHIINDLQERINDPYKLNLLEPVSEVVTGLNDQIDPLQDSFEAYEKADELLDKIYRILEF